MPAFRRKPFLLWPLLAFLLIFFAGIPAQAKHLVGGSVSYKYIGRSGPNNKYYKYRVIITVYRDATGGGPVFDNPITIGLYSAGGSRPIIESKSVFPASETGKKINPVSAGTPCKDMPETEMYETTYTTDFELEASASGYYIFWQRCCRNHQENLPDNEGQTYTAFIPPTNNTNTSPAFSEVPVPYVCSNDTTILVNTASEPDGDSLAYELVWPYAGGSDATPIPALPDFYPDKLPLVQYNNGAGYSFSRPFGSTGYASIDPITGATKIYSQTQGRFALAIDVKEYRNGKLLTTTRRDIQIIVTGCKPSKAPQRQPVSGVIKSNFEIIEGDYLQIPLSFTSEDTLFASASGELFDPSSGISPLAKMDKTVGKYTLTPTITWDSDCNHGRSQPYVINVKVWNNACPPKSINVTLTITVKPFIGVSSILGPSPACVGGPGSVYKAIRIEPGSAMVWKVKGGKIISYPSDNEVLVRWDPGTQGEIQVVAMRSGCSGDTMKRTITLYPKPVTSPILGPQNPCVKTTAKYSVLNNSGSTYAWFVKGGYVSSGGNSNQVDIIWTTVDTAQIYVVQTDSKGCQGDTMRVKPIVRGPSVTKIYGSLSVCPNAKGIDYWVKSQPGSSYTWFVTGGSQASGGFTSHITVNWGDKGTGVIKVVEVTSYGCLSDTIKLSVIKDHILITPPIDGDTSVCEFTKGEKYSVTFSNGSTYDWKIVGGTIVAGTGSATVTVDWENAGTGYLTVTETAYDPVNNLPCLGIPVTTRVTIHPLPDTKGIFGPKEICGNDTASWYVKGFADSRYIWTVNGQTDATEFMVDTTPVLRFAGAAPGLYKIEVIELSKDSCLGAISRLDLLVHPVPKATKITGPTTVCLPELKGHVYAYPETPGSSYEWEIDGGSIVNGLGTSQVTVDWEVAGVREIRIREKSDFGCVGPWNRLDVNVDSLDILIDYVTTQRSNDKLIEVHFRVKNGQFLKKKLRVYRGRSNQDGYSLVDSVDANANIYIDRKAETNTYSYYYYLAAENMCGVTIASPRHRSILARGKFSGDTTMLVHWNPYEGWPGGVNYYHVWQSSNEDTTLSFHELTQDSLMYIVDDMEGWQKCFRVAAVKAQDNSIVSWSNKVCFDFEPIVWIPNVFTPGNYDLINNTFRISVIHHRSFNVTIFNRWGERIFESNDPKIQWDGTFKGKPVPEGIYLYMVEVKGITTRIYRNGTVQVMR
jgi:gliding motility-associated-like protein